MRELPDIREEAREQFEYLKSMLVDNVRGGVVFAPLFLIVTLTPLGQEKMKKPQTILVVPDWPANDQESKDGCIRNIVKMLNECAECAIFCGSGRGTHSGLGDGEITYIFLTVYIRGCEPWTLAQVYTVVEKEVIFDMQCCSSDGNVSSFELPGLWPEEAML